MSEPEGPRGVPQATGEKSMTWGLEGVRVSYGRRVALDAVTVPVDPGRVTVVVGGDGAGKSTCLKALVGRLRPAAGTVRHPAKERIG